MNIIKYLEDKRSIYEDLTEMWIAKSHKSVNHAEKTMDLHAALAYYAICVQYAWMQVTHSDDW